MRVPWMRTEASKVRWTSQATRYCSSNAPIAASSARATWSSYEHILFSYDSFVEESRVVR
ncbi:MAG: hypothetical protein [Olavius algarvensis Gamma 1 endosymbiont]|nr:MAG: hypothetical protein [Olavius algarvensis Gamma 1 endosymbiont]